MVGAGFSRSIYIFAVETSVEQDRTLIEEFNARPNVNHFNPITRNCANFTKSVLDRYFPGAAHRELVNDFGMTSPKAVARSFTRYALRHPELHLHVLHFAQVPGTIKRSTETRDGTEQLYHSKKLLIPLAVVAPHELPVFPAAYLLTGRFNPEHQWEAHPALGGAGAAEPAALTDQVVLNDQERAQLVGTPREWEQYRRAFDEIAKAASRAGEAFAHQSLSSFPKRLDKAGMATLDADGGVWMTVAQDGRTVTVGLSASNVLAPNSDRVLAQELILSRVSEILKSPKHGRESMAEFKQDWALLQGFSSRKAVTLSAAAR